MKGGKSGVKVQTYYKRQNSEHQKDRNCRNKANVHSERAGKSDNLFSIENKKGKPQNKGNNKYG
jgi:hypothetical protein